MDATDEDVPLNRRSIRMDALPETLAKLYELEASAKELCNTVLADEPHGKVFERLRLYVTVGNVSEARRMWNAMANLYSFDFVPVIDEHDAPNILGQQWPRFAQWVTGVRDVYVAGHAQRVFAEMERAPFHVVIDNKGKAVRVAVPPAPAPQLGPPQRVPVPPPAPMGPPQRVPQDFSSSSTTTRK